MKLYGYFRSSAAYRTRIALNLKGLKFDYAAVNLARNESAGAAYRRINPQAIVPALEDDGGAIIPQSMAICEYLEERFPTPAILPRDPVGRARVRAIALNIACEIHPLANRRTQLYLSEQLKLGEDEVGAWCRHWIALNFAAIEQMLDAPATGRFCHGDTPTMADIFLVPQTFNAVRVKLDLTPYPTIRRINEECLKLDAFAAAHPERQPDAVKA